MYSHTAPRLSDNADQIDIAHLFGKCVCMLPTMAVALTVSLLMEMHLSPTLCTWQHPTPRQKKPTEKKDLRFPAWIIVRSCYINKQSKHDCLVISEKLSVIQQEIDSNLLQQQSLSGSQAISSFCCCKLCQSSHLFFFFHLPLKFLILVQNSATILPLETWKQCYQGLLHVL